MCKEIGDCLIHCGCKDGDIYCKHFVRGSVRPEICTKCTSVTCNFELADFTGAGI
jgi:hypothetical protein